MQILNDDLMSCCYFFILRFECDQPLKKKKKKEKEKKRQKPNQKRNLKLIKHLLLSLSLSLSTKHHFKLFYFFFLFSNNYNIFLHLISFNLFIFSSLFSAFYFLRSFVVENNNHNNDSLLSIVQYVVLDPLSLFFSLFAFCINNKHKAHLYVEIYIYKYIQSRFVDVESSSIRETSYLSLSCCCC